MLARASSDAGTRLRRSKSTSVVHRPAPPAIESLDPDTAQQHAIAAATTAFARSQTQRSNERKGHGRVDLRRSKSATSRKSLTSQGSHFPPRELSVRPVPAQRSTQVSSLDQLAAALTPHAEENSAFDSPTIGMRPLSSSRPVPSQPPVISGEHARPASQPKPHGRGMPSSLTSQQIRKARSMYYASSVQTGSPIARPPAKYLITPPAIGTSPSWAHAPKSYVPTRAVGPSPLSVPQVPVSVAPGETIDNARDRYLQDFQRQTVKHKPSMFLAPFKKRQDRSKDSTKLHLSAVTPAVATADQFMNDTAAEVTVDDFMPQSDPKDRRSFSGSLKKKIRRVFRRTTNKSSNLPVQQIEASRDYFTDVPSPMTDSHAEIPSPDEGLLHRVRSRTPSLDPRTRQSASRSSSKESAHSNRSLHSEANISQTSTSRVTSWNTSASGETLTQRAIKRLTVIHESKDSVGSLVERPAPATILKKPSPLPSFSAFKDPMHMESLTEEALTPPVDPKRVFSALMREIDASNPGAVSTHHEPRSDFDTEGDIFGSSKTMDGHLAARELHSSATKAPGTRTTPDLSIPKHRLESVATRGIQSKKTSFRALGQAIRSTIRTVTPGEHTLSPSSEQPATLQSYKHTSSTDSPSKSQGGIEDRPATLKKPHVSKKRNLFVQKSASIETSIPTAEQIEIRVAKAKARWQAPLNESMMPQFPRETDRLHAMTYLDQDTADRTLDAHRNQMPKALQMPTSPSVYSRDTDGVSLPPTDSVVSLANTHKYESVNPEGSAVILTSQSVRSYVIGTPSPNRASSTCSSRDWRAWLSQEVSSIETASQEELKISGNYDVSSRRAENRSHHSMRTLQINPEDTTELEQVSLEILTPRAHSADPLKDLQQQESSSSGSEDCSRRALNTLVKSKDDQSHLKNFSSGEKPVPPPIVSGRQVLVPTCSPSHTYENCSTSTSSSTASSPQCLIGTPNSSRMNDRFPFIDTGKRVSSRNSSQSHQSKAPSENRISPLNSSRSTPGLESFYRSSFGSTARAPNTASHSPQVSKDTKENMIPSSALRYDRPISSQIALASRPKSLQPLSSAITSQDATKVTERASTPKEASRSKRVSYPETIVARPNLRVTVRPLTGEKLSRRPRSAFDLRNTPPPRQASEFRRAAVPVSIPLRQPDQDGESYVGTEKLLDTTNDSEQRSGSITPGQRLAERFLKERKSATVLERGVRKSTGKFVREDTPAFL